MERCPCSADTWRSARAGRQRVEVPAARAGDGGQRRRRPGHASAVPALEPGAGPAPGADHHRVSLILADECWPPSARTPTAIVPPETLRPALPRGASTTSPTRGFRLAMLAAAILIGLIFWLVYKRTRVGMVVRAGVDDTAMTSALGVNVQRVFAAGLLRRLGTGRSGRRLRRHLAVAGARAGPGVPRQRFRRRHRRWHGQSRRRRARRPAARPGRPVRQRLPAGRVLEPLRPAHLRAARGDPRGAATGLFGKAA